MSELKQIEKLTKRITELESQLKAIQERAKKDLEHLETNIDIKVVDEVVDTAISVLRDLASGAFTGRDTDAE